MMRDPQTIGGKVSILTAFLGVGVILIGLVIDLPGGHSKVADAATATTSVTVLNTPPTWFVDAQEAVESSTSSPTNSGSNVSWNATAQDSSNDNYYLIICKNGLNATPTANPSAAPTCSGGSANQWAVSAATASGTQASAATTTYDGDPMESGTWYAWICDGNATTPRCNDEYRQGTGSFASPFAVNHRPTFTAYYDNSPFDPGNNVTFYATSSDPDVDGAADQVRLFVCRSNDFTGSNCGPGGTWATSSLFASNPATSTFIGSPFPDSDYAAYGYIVDSHGHTSQGASQGTNAIMVINNTTPTIAAGQVSIFSATGTPNYLILTNPGGQTSGYRVEFTVTDSNSCQNVAGGSEIGTSSISVYRSGVTQAGCDGSSEYNPNSCYTMASSTWTASCVASSTDACGGTGDSTRVVTCTFPLWFLADATDGTGGPATDPPFFAQDWRASASTSDDDWATSSFVEGTNVAELISFLAYDTSTTTISYGALQPTQQNDPIGPNANMIVGLRALGNVGLDQTLYGADMCPTYPSCTGNATSTIFVNNQKYATSSVAYASGVTLLANPGAEVEMDVPKSTTTDAVARRDTHWGILVPGAITLSGDYIGVNTLIGITGERSAW